MGDWYLGPDPENPNRLKWLYDKDAPAPSIEHTAMFPAVQPATPDLDEVDEYADVYEREDGSIYARLDPAEFENFDKVDSRLIQDPGAPR